MAQQLVIAVTLLLSTSLQAKAETRYCVVELENPSKIQLIGREYHRIPGLAPVFTPLATNSRWTISADRKLIPYNGPFPKSYLDSNPDYRASFAFDDHWKLEPWSRRIVASAWGDPAISTLKNGDMEFRPVQQEQYGYSLPYILPKTKETLVSRDGELFVVAEDTLKSWAHTKALKKAGVEKAVAIYDMSSISATVVRDGNDSLWVSLDEEKWKRLAVSPIRSFGKMFDLPSARAAVFVSAKSVTKISRRLDQKSPLRAEVLVETSANGADREFAYLTQFAELLSYSHGSLSDLISTLKLSSLEASWKKLTPNGFQAIPGGNDIRSAPSESAGWRVRELKSLGIALIDGYGGFFAYDGDKISPIKGGMRSDVGRWPSIDDIPSIGRAFVRTHSGLKELTTTELRDVPDYISPSALTIVDWPEAERGVIFYEDKAVIISRDLTISQTVDLKEIGFDSAVSGGTNPLTGDLIFAGKRSIFLLLDTYRSGQEACRPDFR